MSADAERLTLALPRPTNPSKLRAQLAPSSLGVLWRFDGDTCSRALPHAEGPRELHLLFADETVLAVLRGAPMPPGQLEHTVRRLLSLDAPLAAIERALARDHRFADLVRRHSGLRITRTANLWEALVTAVVGQQVSVAAANGIRRRLIALGPASPSGLMLFPSPREMLSMELEVLRATGLSRQKTAYLLAIAEALTTGSLDEQALEAADGAAVEQALLALRGVGRWSAEVVRMRHFGHLDVWPAGDLGLQRGLQRLLGLGARPDAESCRAFAAGLGDRAAVLCFYIWADSGRPD